MNAEAWTVAFTTKISEVSNLQPLQTPQNDDRSITIQKMYGRFNCSTCKRPWTSTKCVTEITYNYDFITKTGKIQIEREFKQSCKRCSQPSNPSFDLEATTRAMEIVIKRIKRIYYRILPDVNDHGESSKHSKAQERKAEHDSKNCEACKVGKCSFNNDFSGVRNRRHRANVDNVHIPRSRPMSWTLSYNGKVIVNGLGDSSFINSNFIEYCSNRSNMRQVGAFSLSNASQIQVDLCLRVHHGRRWLIKEAQIPTRILIHWVHLRDYPNHNKTDSNVSNELWSMEGNNQGASRRLDVPSVFLQNERRFGYYQTYQRPHQSQCYCSNLNPMIFLLKRRILS